MLEVKNLSVAYGKHIALNDISLDVSVGEIVVILGANGAGKSTMLRSVAGICEGSVSGGFFLDGKSLNHLNTDQLVEEGIALVPEGRGIFGDLTVKENLSLGAYSNRARGQENENLERVFSLFPKLLERQNQVARTMSGGEQQMVAIGRAIMSSPKILMLDEPSLGLSPILCAELFSNLSAIKTLPVETDKGVLAAPNKIIPSGLTPRRSADQQIGSSIDAIVNLASEISSNSTKGHSAVT
ncbi:MAG: ABC transporter ATP-binding protein, partial [Rhodobacteraceae bacterium]|nr:ABC transporter ATP-binding protein [Paracoccaceae bacterium]